MNMKKKLFNWTLMAAMCSGLGLTIVACSDDDDKKAPTVEAVTIESDLLTHGIETDMQSAVIEVPVKCNGQWTATLKEGTNWAQILDWQVTFNGPKTLTLILDENLSKVDRSTTLTIGNSTWTKSKELPNYQQMLNTGRDGEINYDKELDWFEVKGWNPDKNNISVTVEGNPNDITFPKTGEAPKVIAVDPTTNWMFERTPAPESWFKD